MAIRRSFRSEGRVLFVAAIVFVAISIGGLDTGTSDPSFWAAVTMCAASVWFAWRALRLGRIRLDASGLVVTQLGRTRRWRFSDVVRFEARVVPRGLGHVREVLFVTLSDTSTCRLDSIHAAPSSAAISTLAAELNQELHRLARELDATSNGDVAPTDSPSSE